MKRKAGIIGLSVAALSVLCIIVLAVFKPFSETIPTEPINSNALSMDYVYIEDLAEYHKCIAAAELPDNFVTAEMLSDLGEFEVFYVDPYDFSGYMYCLNTIDGHEITLHVTHDPGRFQDSIYKDWEALDISKAGTNMLQLKTEEQGIITRDGVEYRYRFTGDLGSISWIADNIQFTLSANGGWPDYTKLSKNSPLYYIMSASETEFASALTLINAIPTKNDHVTE